MNKKEFLEALGANTSALSDRDRERLLDYYAELIDDSVEEGLSEAEAVAALGDPAALAKEFASAKTEAAPADDPRAESVPGLGGLRVRVIHADVTIKRQPLDNGAAAQLRFSDPARFEWRMDGDVMEVVEKEPEGGRFSARRMLQMLSSPGLRATVVLSDALSGGLDYSAAGGDLYVDGVELGGGAALSSASGDIRLKNVALGEALEIQCRSGDVKAENLRAAAAVVHSTSGDITADRLATGGELRLETANGDVELRSLECGALKLSTASGDIEIDRGRAGAAAIRTASGDARLDELEANPTLDVETASGDIDLSRCIALETRLTAASGDVSVRLEPLPCGYDITVNSVSGDIRFAQDEVPAQEGVKQPRLEIRTVSGDIGVRMA